MGPGAQAFGPFFFWDVGADFSPPFLMCVTNSMAEEIGLEDEVDDAVG